MIFQKWEVTSFWRFLRLLKSSLPEVQKLSKGLLAFSQVIIYVLYPLKCIQNYNNHLEKPIIARLKHLQVVRRRPISPDNFIISVGNWQHQEEH